MAKPIPDGYHTVTPYLIVTNAVDAIEFYKRAFGATERMCLIAPDGKVAHGEIKIGDSIIMLADETTGIPQSAVIRRISPEYFSLRRRCRRLVSSSN